MRNKEINPVIVFIFGFITFGLTNHMFLYIISKRAVKNASGELIYPMREVGLNIITLGIYGIIWTYRMGIKFYENKNSAVLCAVISAFPVRCVSMTMLVSQMNFQTE